MKQRRIRQRGQGTVEFLLVAPVILLLGFSSIEALHWFFARQAVSQALVQAARAAATQHAHPEVLDTAFAQALLPWYASASLPASEGRLQRAMKRREATTGLPAWRIEILSPSVDTFQDFASDNRDLPRSDHAIIDNDYLHEQHLARVSAGRQHGRGPISGQTTLEANTLILALTWLHEPLLPGVKQVIKQLSPKDQRYGSQAMARAGYLPIHRQVSMVMQSHPVAWAMPAHGRVHRAGESITMSTPHSGAPLPAHAAAASACQGLWCLHTPGSRLPIRDNTGPLPAPPATPTDEYVDSNPYPGSSPNPQPNENPNPTNHGIGDGGFNDNGPDEGPVYGSDTESGHDSDLGPGFDPDDCPGCCS